MAIIELNNIRVSYETKKNKVDAVKDTTIHIEKGDIFGIIGYSGAGKSTIVRTINLLQKPSAGEVKVNGKVLFKAGAASIVWGPQSHPNMQCALRISWFPFIPPQGT